MKKGFKTRDKINLQRQEKSYLSLRTKEGRIHSDQIVQQLPFVERSHIHYKEWRTRQHAFKILKKYLKSKNKTLRILDLGCGNGWMSRRLMDLGNEVIGLDINTDELKQATRLFQNANLQFLNQDIFERPQIGKFNCILLASSIQYFSNFKELIELLKTYLTPDGEIIIMESHFYTQMDIDEAKSRSLKYFKENNAEEMNEFYFHHTLDSLNEFKLSYIYKNPQSIISKLLAPHQSIFPIITISGI